jgi:hypothetical protein
MFGKPCDEAAVRGMRACLGRQAVPASSTSGRATGTVVALLLLVLTVVLVPYLRSAGGGRSEYELVLHNAGQLVRGDRVEVDRVPSAPLGT